MINAMRVKPEIERNTKTLDDVIKSIIRLYHNYKVMFIYYGGSLAYGTYSQGKSDIDLEVFIDGIPYASKTEYCDVDLFIYPKEYITKRFDMSDNLNGYRKSFADVYLGLPGTLVYLNEEYRKEFEEYISFDFKTILPQFLGVFIDYYGFCLEDAESLGKKFYHIIRMRGQLERYLETGKFGYETPEGYKEEMLDFKCNWDNKEKNKIYSKKIKNYFEEIKKIKEELEHEQP